MRNPSLRVWTLAGILIAGCTNPTTGPQTASGPPPATFYMNQNFPNPFTDTTSVEYGVPSAGGVASRVTVIVYDRFQQEIRTIVFNNSHPAGLFFAKWDGLDNRGTSVSPGIYIIELRGYTPQTTIIQVTALKR